MNMEFRNRLDRGLRGRGRGRTYILGPGGVVVGACGTAASSTCTVYDVSVSHSPSRSASSSAIYSLASPSGSVVSGVPRSHGI